MAILRQDALGTLSQGLTRGRHLLNDAMVQLILFGMIALLTLSGWSYQWWSGLNTVQQDYWWLWLKAHSAVWLGFPQIDINYLFEKRWQTQSAGEISAWQSLNDYVAALHDRFIDLWSYPVLMGTTAWLALAWYLYHLGGNQVDHDVIEGVQLVSPAVYQKTVGKQASDIK